MQVIDPPAAGNQQLKGGQGAMSGFSVRETAGASAVVRFFDGTDNTGKLMASVSLVANESVREWYGSGNFEGLPFSGGLFLERVSGSSEVVAYA